MISSPPNRRYSIGGHSFEAEKPEPGLHLVATPIGNLGDITLRALGILAGVDCILCEDTRITARLLDRYDIRTRLSPLHDFNEARAVPDILARIAAGATMALVSDAGTPLVSDPGFVLVRAAAAQGLPVSMAPGPSAPLMALALSGLPASRFMFCGFFPEKAGERTRLLETLERVCATLLFFESPHRIIATLDTIGASENYAVRALAVTRELTKVHEEVLRGTALEIAEILRARPSVKGEITLVIAPPEQGPAFGEDAVEAMLAEAARTLPLSQAAAEVATRTGLKKRDLYQRLLALKPCRTNDPDSDVD